MRQIDADALIQEIRQPVRGNGDYFTGIDDERARCLDIIQETPTAVALPTTDRPDILAKAIDTYGARAQKDMAIEEMSELIKALLKNRRARAHEFTATRANIIEKMADVIIMLLQLCMMYDAAGEVQTAIEEKVTRLENRLACAGKQAGEPVSQDAAAPAT